MAGGVLNLESAQLWSIGVAIGDDLGLLDGQCTVLTVQVDRVDTGDREAGQVGIRIQNRDDLQVGLECPVAGDLTRSPLDLHLSRRHLVLVGRVVADRQHDTVRRPVGDVEAGRGQQLSFIHIARGVNSGLDMVGGVLDDECPAVLDDGHRRLDVGDVDLDAGVASEVERIDLRQVHGRQVLVICLGQRGDVVQARYIEACFQDRLAEYDRWIPYLIIDRVKGADAEHILPGF